ncbi:MAG: hypothetical protein LAP40_14190 [Acidobacteriia bacterium]|nr:hypothetical protein [Terriglobia bacterium]
MSDRANRGGGQTAKTDRLPRLLVVLAFTGLALAQPEPKDFRQTTWGMTKAQVVAAEATKPAAVTESNGEVIVRYDSVPFAHLDAQVVYILARDRLVRAKFLFSAEHADANDFIGDYKNVEPLLLGQYGKPADSRAIWEDDSTQLEPKSYLDQDRASPANILTSDAQVGLAVSLGHMRMFTQWDCPRTTILHALTGRNHHITHQIEYRSVEWSALEQEVRPVGTKPAL